MSRVNLKLKYRKGNYLPGSYDVDTLQDLRVGKFYNLRKMVGIILEKQHVKLLMVS